MKYKETSDKIINAFFKVYNKLGTGFLEKTYENALLLELKAIRQLSENDNIQLLNYLSATGVESGLIFNFSQKPQVKRKFLKQKQSV